MTDTSLTHKTLRDSLAIVSLVAGFLLFAMGVMVIIGWHAGSSALVQIRTTWVPMQYNTALGFVFCGLSIVCLARNWQRATVATGAIAATLGGLTVVEYLSGMDVGIDQLFMEHYIQVETSTPGRMAPNTAICFLLLGIVAVTYLNQWSSWRWAIFRSTLVSLALGLSIVALTGYFTSKDSTYGWGELTKMAMHTSIGFVIGSIGHFALAWRRSVRGTFWMPPWMPITVFIAILTVTVCLWQALSAEGWRIRRMFEEMTGNDFVGVTNIATLMLVLGSLLAVATALVAFLAQKSSRRAQQLAAANASLREEVRVRQKAEADLQQHRDQLEDLVRERTREYQQACREAEAANRAKSDFLSHMSHELRTPLNGILGYAQILQRDRNATQRQCENLEAIISCGDHLLALINDVLDLSKIEAGRLEVDQASLNLEKLLGGITDVVRGRASRKGLTFETDVAPEVPAGIITDGAKLRQILVNLLGNAVKFTEEGGVTLRVREHPSGLLRFDVIDTGVGIDSQELEEIFDPFKQVEAGKVAGGTGLGLAISRQLAEALGGHISVTSVVQQGSTFSLSLPLDEASAEEVEALANTDAANSEHLRLAEGQQVTILVADDRDTNRDVLRQILEQAGFDTVMANDGVEAVEMLEQHSEVQLVLMDLRMPRMNGLEALQRIRSDNRFSNLKVVAVTASVFSDFEKQAANAGFDGFVAKPFRMGQLLALLAEQLHLELVSDDEPDDDIPTNDAEPSKSLTAEMPSELRDRLREALRIKNLTVINSVAQTLCEDPGTAACGREISRLARAFDFQGLSVLATQMEYEDG
jgi:signal transduction histidine kinase/CheY-like chemotaxis protein